MKGEVRQKWLLLEKKINGEVYKYHTTEPSKNEIIKYRKKGYKVRITTREAIREMWIRKRGK